MYFYTPLHMVQVRGVGVGVGAAFVRCNVYAFYNSKVDSRHVDHLLL